MIEQALRLGKRLRRMPVLGPLINPLANATGLVDASRSAYNKRLKERGTHRVSFLDQPVDFSVVSDREIVRLDADFNEADYLGRFVESIRPGDVVFDIGANIGIWTLVAALKLDDASRAAGTRFLAFEPDPANAAQLRRNVELNSLQGTAEAVEIACSDADGEFELFLGGEAGAGTHTLKADRAKSDQTVTVKTERADAFCEQAGCTPDVVKIDVEGFELSVLAGMRGLLQAGRPREFFIEVHTGGPDPVLESDVDGVLEPLGYSAVWRHRRDKEVHVHYALEGKS